MNSTSSARSSANSPRYSASGLTADATGRSRADAGAQHVALGAACRERHDDDGGDDARPRPSRHRGRCGGGRPRDGRARDAHAAGCRGAPQRPHALVAACARPARAGTRARRGEPESRSRPARRASPGPAAAARSRWCGRRRARRDHRRARPGRRRTRRAILAPRQQQARARADEEHDERGHQQVAVRADGQVDRHEVLPREERAGRELAEPRSELGRTAQSRRARRAARRAPGTRRPSSARDEPAAPAAAPARTRRSRRPRRRDRDEQQERPRAVDRPGGDAATSDHDGREQRAGDDARHERAVPRRVGAPTAPRTDAALMTSPRAAADRRGRRGCRR